MAGGMVWKRLQALRDKTGETQEAVASAVDISTIALSRYENDARTPRPAILARLAEHYGVSIDYLMGESDLPMPSNAYPASDQVAVPILGAIRCGPGGLAEQEVEGYGLADVARPEEHFLLRVVGDSMEPDITEGMLALIHRQEDVECGEVAAVGIDGEEGTLKRVLKQGGSIILQAFNAKYAPRIFAGRELDRLTIFGKLVETRRRW